MKKYCIYCLIVLMSVGCRKFERMSDAELCFDVEFSSTKGSGFLSSQNITSFGVSSCETSQKFSTRNTVVGTKMKNEKVSKTESGWKTTNRYYYPNSGYVSFFAYAPYIGDESICNDNNYSKGMYVLTYSPSSDVSKQVDFCISKPTLDKTKSKDPIRFNFLHTLSNIVFVAAYTGMLPNNCSVYIDSVIVSGIKASGNLTYKSTQPYYEWSLSSDRTGYSMGRKSGCLSDSPLQKQVGIELNGQGSGGMLFLLPQTTDTDAVATVYAGIYDINSQKVAEKVLTLPIPETQWTAGGRVKYSLTIQIEEQYSISVKDWKSVSIPGTIG